LRLLPEQTYLRNFLKIGIGFAIIILIFSFFLRREYAEQAYGDVNRLMSAKTSSVSQGLEYQLDQLRAYALNMYQDPDIFHWLMADRGEPLVASSALKSISKFLSLQSFIDTTYLINMKTRQVIDSGDGIHTFDNFADRGVLDRILEQPPSTLRFYNHESPDGNARLALIAPAYKSGISSQGYVVILLDKELLETYLLQNLNEASTNIMVVDESGAVILGGSPDIDAEQIIRRDPATHETKSGDQIYLVHSYAFKAEEWTLHSTVRVKDISKNIDRIQFRLFGMCLFLLIVLSVLSYWNSRRQFKPFSQLARQIRKTVAPDAQMAEQRNYSEFAVIKTGLDHMVKTMDEMNNIIRNHRDVVKNELLRQWLLQGGYSKEMEENEALRQFLVSDIRLAVIRINRFQSFSERYSYASRKLLLYAMGNIAGEILSRHGFAAESVDLGSDQLVLLVGGGAEDADPVLALKESDAAIGQWLNLNVTSAISDRTPIKANMRALYEKISDLTLLRFFDADDKVYVEADLAPYLPERQSDLDEGAIHQLIESTRKAQKEAVREQLDFMFEELQKLTYAECQFRLKLLLFHVFKAFSKAIGEREQGADHLLRQFDTLMDVKDWLYRQLEALIDSAALQHSSSTRREELAAEIFDYVKQHLHDPMLTLESIADYMMLSGSYVRLVFKETYHITLSGFIHQERLEQAKQLLVSTDWPVLDIAERSGFQSKTTFFTSFKKYTGLTPNQYREQNRE
jgi:AraC-like DNA-binding protein